MTALTSDLNYASLFYIVVIVRAGIFCSESVVLRCIRQLCGILASRFSCGYRNTVVAGYFHSTLTRNTGNSQRYRTAAGQRIRSCLDSDCRSSLFSPLGVVGVACFKGSCRIVKFGIGIPIDEFVARFCGGAQSSRGKDRIRREHTVIHHGHTVFYNLRFRIVAINFTICKIQATILRVVDFFSKARYGRGNNNCCQACIFIVEGSIANRS